MNPIKKILLATDFSDTSALALEHARMLAGKTGAELHVLYVYVEPIQIYGVSGFPVPVEMGAQDKEKVQAKVAQWCGDAGIAIAEFERDYSAPMAIRRYAEEQDIDVVVVGTHGRQGVSRFFLGSVASEVIRTSSIPVLAVGPDQASRPEGYRKILAAVDFSEASLLAFHQAVHLAELFEGELTALHAVDTGKMPPYYPGEFARVEMSHAQQALDDLLAPGARDIRIDRLVAMGAPHELIVETAVGGGSDLIVVGTAGLRGLKGLLTGSVADRVVRSAPCPVLVLHNPVMEDKTEQA